MRLLAVAFSLLAMTVPAGRAAGAPPSLVAACGNSSGIAAHPLWLTAADGVRLYAIEAGKGSTAVVLAHQGGSDLCEELPYAKTLLARGLRIVAFDFRGNGRSELPAKDSLALGRDLAAAVSRAHAQRAKHVFLIGASMGGAAVVQNGAGLRVDGLVSLSGTRLWPGYGINKPGPAPYARRFSTSAAVATRAHRCRKRDGSSAASARTTNEKSSFRDPCTAGNWFRTPHTLPRTVP